MNEEIIAYNSKQNPEDLVICNFLAHTINNELSLAESKIWHSHPVWFLDGNPIVGYSKQKAGWRLMFWSGASIFYNNVSDIDVDSLKRWLKKSTAIQWDYKNIVKRKGQLERLK